MRVGFLFNHDQVHQVAHLLPVALAMADLGGFEVILAVSSHRLETEIRRLAGDRLDHVSIVSLTVRSHATRAASRLLDRALPARKLLLYGDNLSFFRSLDALVVAEKTSLVLKRRFGLDRLMMIHTRHGAGDRAIGFDASSRGFDLVLVSGSKIRDRLVREAGVAPTNIAIVGYPKFDLGMPHDLHGDLFADSAPIVLYNPHVSPRLSSWYRMGRQVLDFFLADKRYNLVFAPHVMLFERRVALSIAPPALAFPGRIPGRYRDPSNIHVDLGSPASTDMSYTNAADIYLGDVSSQVYEFMVRPRPCLFLNAHHVSYRDDPNYAHWRAGQVIDSVEDLGPALAAAKSAHEATGREAQLQLLAATFDLTEEPSASRAARAIATKLSAVSR